MEGPKRLVMLECPEPGDEPSFLRDHLQESRARVEISIQGAMILITSCDLVIGVWTKYGRSC
jgi:hypothetical protein